MSTFRGGPGGGQIQSAPVKKGLVWIVAGALGFIALVVLAIMSVTYVPANQPPANTKVEAGKAVTAQKPAFELVKCGTRMLRTDKRIVLWLEDRQEVAFSPVDPLFCEVYIDDIKVAEFGPSGTPIYFRDWKKEGKRKVSFALKEGQGVTEVRFGIFKYYGTDRPSDWFEQALLAGPG